MLVSRISHMVREARWSRHESHPRALRMVCLVYGAAGLLLFATQGHAQAKREADDAHIRERCRFAAQILTTGEPHTHHDWAVAKIRTCDESAGPALAA